MHTGWQGMVTVFGLRRRQSTRLPAMTMASALRGERYTDGAVLTLRRGNPAGSQTRPP